ncbi:Autoinducer 2 kinase LsrK [Raoultella planticola]|nr:Autoinducer 2 kinase LsrK [Raoultella planticola]
MSYLLALDAGTGSIRAVIFDLSGHQVAVGQAEWKHLSVENVPGSMEFDLTTNWLLACQCIRQALANAHLQAADIQSVACCSMREGIVLYDRNGEAIWACANVDARASREVAELKEIHDYHFESEVYDVSGQTLALSAMPRLLWLAHHRPDIYRQAATITMISDWLAAKLSGELAVDPSNAGTTGMLDLFSRDWRPALLDMAGLRADLLSPVKETGTPLGAVTETAARQCGLRAGTPVIMGGGDVQLGCLGLGGGTRRPKRGAGGHLLATGGESAGGPYRSADEYSYQPARHSRHGAGRIDQLLHRPDHALVPRCFLRRREAGCRTPGSGCLCSARRDGQPRTARFPPA